MRDLLVIGTASLDTLHFGEKTVHSAGGAGLYTALAAHHAGAEVTLFAPRPTVMPEPLQPIAERLDWRGPAIETAALPRLEIRHHGGGKATLVGASWGAEVSLLPGDLPADLSDYRYVHIAALSSAQRQWDFLQTCRERHARQISVGTYARIAYGETLTVLKLFGAADVGFMNENEANGLFQSVDQVIHQVRPEQVIIVTLAERGALLFHAGKQLFVPTQAAQEIDPTGAGDTVCGTFLAKRSQGADLLAATQAAIIQATRMIGYYGPEALL